MVHQFHTDDTNSCIEKQEIKAIVFADMLDPGQTEEAPYSHTIKTLHKSALNNRENDSGPSNLADLLKIPLSFFDPAIHPICTSNIFGSNICPRHHKLVLLSIL